jgi:hypothetical protein
MRVVLFVTLGVEVYFGIHSIYHSYLVACKHQLLSDIDRKLWL